MIDVIKRLEKGSALTFEEMDSNFDKIKYEISARSTSTETSISIINAILNIRDNVSIDGDTLAKLYNLILELNNKKIDKVDITDNLDGLDPSKVLSAVQGKTLKDLLIAEINNRILSLNSEITRASNAEQYLRNDLNNEIANRNTAINNAVLSIQSNLYSHG